MGVTKSWTQLSDFQLSKGKGNKNKNKLKLNNNNKKILHSKENHQQKEKTAYGIEENIYKYILHMELISNTYMEFTQLNSKK